MDAKNQAESFWNEYSHLLEPTGNTTADEEQKKGFERQLNTLSPEARGHVNGWRNGGRTTVPQGNPYYTEPMEITLSAGSVHDFGADSDKLNEISVELNSCADEIRQDITDIFAKIKELSNYWSGQAYEEFSANCEKYRSALEGLVVLLEAFSKKFDMLDSETVDLANTIGRYIDNAACSLGGSRAYGSYGGSSMS